MPQPRCPTTFTAWNEALTFESMGSFVVAACWKSCIYFLLPDFLLRFPVAIHYLTVSVIGIGALNVFVLLACFLSPSPSSAVKQKFKRACSCWYAAALRHDCCCYNLSGERWNRIDKHDYLYFGDGNVPERLIIIRHVFDNGVVAPSVDQIVWLSSPARHTDEVNSIVRICCEKLMKFARRLLPCACHPHSDCYVTRKANVPSGEVRQLFAA